MRMQASSNAKVRDSAADAVAGIGMTAAVLCFAAACAVPFWLVIVNSFAPERVLAARGYTLWPENFSAEAYRFLFRGGRVFDAYGVSILVTAVGTAAATLMTASYAWVLAHRQAQLGRALSFITYFTMVFGAGLVGFYILVSRWLGLKDSLAALILPYLLNPFYAFILVSYYRTIPFELYESAVVDGADDISIFFKIIWPVSVPAVATVVLFYAIQYWNDWWLALLFIDNERLHPLQMMIRRVVSNINAAAYVGGGAGMNYGVAPPNQGMQLAIVCLTIGPVLSVYPFVQRFFVKGITIGSIKG